MAVESGSLERYLRTAEAARYLSLSPRTLEKHRTFGTGPAYRKLGGRVVYAPEDLQEWAERGRRSSTSDPGTATVHPAKTVIAGTAAAKQNQRDHRPGQDSTKRTRG